MVTHDSLGLPNSVAEVREQSNVAKCGSSPYQHIVAQLHTRHRGVISYVSRQSATHCLAFNKA